MPKLVCSYRSNAICIGFFFIVLLVGILPPVDWLKAIPGDLGDARFNSVILEHSYKFLFEAGSNFWSPEFFYPFPGVLAFSDTHLGSVWSYVILRGLGLDREHAFQWWIIVGMCLN